jgi:hypothetical protein
LATGVFWRASVFSSRTSSLVHSRRFAFFAIFTGSNVFKSGFLTQHYRARQRIFIAPAGTLNKHRRASPNKWRRRANKIGEPLREGGPSI